MPFYGPHNRTVVPPPSAMPRPAASLVRVCRFGGAQTRVSHRAECGGAGFNPSALQKNRVSAAATRPRHTIRRWLARILSLAVCGSTSCELFGLSESGDRDSSLSCPLHRREHVSGRLVASPDSKSAPRKTFHLSRNFLLFYNVNTIYEHLLATKRPQILRSCRS